MVSRAAEAMARMQRFRGAGAGAALDAAPPTLDKSLEPAVALHGINRFLVPPVGHDRQGIRAVDVGAIDEIASAGIERVVVDKFVFAAMLADAVV